MRPKLLLLAAVAAVSAFVPVDRAAAAGDCSILAPTKVVIEQSYQEVPLRLATNCSAAGRTYAEWFVVHPSKGPTDILTFTSNTVDHWDVYPWPGRYTVMPNAAWDSDGARLEQNTAWITAKLGSRLTAATTRSVGRLTFDAYARTWSPIFDDWYRRARANVSLMYLAPGSSTWTFVKYATTDSTGRVRLSVAPTYGSYRLMIKETDKVWASHSPAVRGR